MTFPSAYNGELCGEGQLEEEWFRLELIEAGRLTVHLEGDINLSDIDLALFDESARLGPGSRRTIASSTGVGSRERLEPDLAPGVYFVRVYCFAGKGATKYRIEFQFNPVPPPPPPPQPGVDEAGSHGTLIHESAKSAIGLGYKYQSRWYKYDVPSSGTLQIQFFPNVKTGALRFEVFDEKSEFAGKVTSDVVGKLLTVCVHAGRYQFHVEPVSPDTTGSFDFNVAFARRAAPPTPPSPHPSPAPVSPPAARVVTPPEPPRGSAISLPHNGSVAVGVGGPASPPAQWYKFTLLKRSQVYVVFKGQGRIAASVFRQGVSSSCLGASAANGERLIAGKFSRGTYEIRVSATRAAGGFLDLQVFEANAESGFTRKDGSASHPDVCRVGDPSSP